MLLKLGKYLRCPRYDCTWDAGWSARDAIAHADREERVFLTRNTRIGDGLPLPRRCVVLREEDPVEQTQRVVRELHLDVRTRLFTRCIRCDVELVTVVDREAVRARVPEDVFERRASLDRCPSCDTVFWKGSHVANTCRKLGIEGAEEDGEQFDHGR